MINESLGSTAGDALLRAIGERLRSSVRAADDLARIGADEFVVILDDLARDEDAEMLATRMLERFGQPFQVEGRTLTIAVSLGFSVFPRDADDPEMLLKQADTAMLSTRRGRRTRLQRYDASMTDQSSDALSLEQGLRLAIERHELQLDYQPQVDVADGRLVGVEALLRWRHPEQGVLAPTSFVPLAEDLGLIVPIGQWVLESACRQVAAWQKDGVGSIRVSVNVSPQQFLSEDLTRSVALALDEAGINPELLTLEITESLIDRELDRVIDTMRELKGMGVGLALDDFGVGYSSLNHLKRLPIDWLKIDRSFVHDLSTDAHDRTICLAILAMARSLGRRVIAEGVETLEQLEFLRAKGCDEIQGYFTGRPGAPAEISNLVRRRVLRSV
jgi:diguanylate cyclase (GGDEF)-like protein